ncbi:MAG: response regulator [Planctomycetota bacterium JB042]
MDSRFGEKRLTVLLIEDDDFDAAAVEREMAKAGVGSRIVRATSGREGLDVLREIRSEGGPLLVILDLNLPDMDGKDVLARIRGDRDLADVVVFVLSTSVDPRDLRRSFDLHVAAYIVKDVAGSSLRGVVDMIEAYRRCARFPEDAGRIGRRCTVRAS